MNEAQLKANGLIETEFCRKAYRVSVPPNVKSEDLTRPAFWAHVAKDLRRGDMIEVLAEDNSFYAEVLVRSARRTDATVSMLRFQKLDKPVLEKSDTEGYEIIFRGGRAKHTVMRNTDIIKEGFGTYEEAELYLKNLLKAMAA